MTFKKTASLALLQYCTSLAVLILLWDLIIRMFRVPAFLLPSPGAVFSTLINEKDRFFAAANFTTRNAFLGALIGTTSAALVSLILAAFRPVRWLCEPYLTVFQSFPREALLPLFLTWLGFGPSLKIASSSMLCFFPVTMILLAALLNTRIDYLLLLQNWGAGDFRILCSLRIPYAIPSLVSAIKLAIPLSLIGSVLGEFMGGNEGIGYLIMSSSGSFRVDRICAGIVVLCLIGGVAVSMLVFIQTVFLKRFYQE